jgi:hypothetical protein
MSRREAWLSALLVFAAAAAVRAWAAGQVHFPIPEDAAYYWGVARNFVEGHGLTSSTIWSFRTPALDSAGAPFIGFPRPAFEIWLPLATLLALVPMTLAGSSDYGATVGVPVMAGALTAVLAWRIAADVADELGLPTGRARTLALGTGLVSALWLPLVLSAAVLDSTAPFGAAALAACLVMERLLRRPPLRPWDGRVVLLGILIGVAALARNEAIWVGLAWALLAVPAFRGRGFRFGASAVAVAGLAAVAVMGPWLLRDWLTFGSPMPGQAIGNAFSLSGYDIFAWQDPPTLARYLAAGPAVLLGQRVEGFGHNLLDVLVVPGFPVSVIGVLALPWCGRSTSLRPLLVVAGLTFGVTTLFFPVATTWGTFLHAAVPTLALLLIVALVALDGGLDAVGRRRGWTRPTAWLGPVFAGAVAVLFTALAMPAYASHAASAGQRYAALGTSMNAAGFRLDPAVPVIASHPMWFAEANRVRTIALPDESVASVVDLARTFGARYVVLEGRHGSWPGRLAEDPQAACLSPLTIPGAAADGFAVYEVACP